MIALFVAFLIKIFRDKIVVKKSSAMLESLKKINEKYPFCNSIPKRYNLAISLTSKNNFDRYELSTLVDTYILENEEFQKLLKDLSHNINSYSAYKSEIDLLETEISENQAKKLHISYSSYKRIERRLFNKIQLKPVLDSNIECLAQYTTPKGRYTYTKTNTFNAQYCINRASRLSELAAMQNTESARRKRERALMTDKLRYAILKRDGFRCKLCGRSADDGAKLHIDHIIPVSKGGRTVESNLRVLCDACNLGKSDTLE